MEKKNDALEYCKKTYGTDLGELKKLIIKKQKLLDYYTGLVTLPDGTVRRKTFKERIIAEFHYFVGSF